MDDQLPTIDAAMRRAAVIWIAPADGSAGPQLVWQHWSGSASYVLTGPGEQPVPGITPGSECLVTTRPGGTGSGTWVAGVQRVEPDGAEWAQVAPALVAARLNAPDLQDLPARWARTATLLRLTPAGTMIEPGGTTVHHGRSDPDRRGSGLPANAGADG